MPRCHGCQAGNTSGRARGYCGEIQDERTPLPRDPPWDTRCVWRLLHLLRNQMENYNNFFKEMKEIKKI